MSTEVHPSQQIPQSLPTNVSNSVSMQWRSGGLRGCHDLHTNCR